MEPVKSVLPSFFARSSALTLASLYHLKTSSTTSLNLDICILFLELENDEITKAAQIL